jgi:hypothetical protein
MSTSIGAALDQLGILADIEEGALVSSAVVVLAYYVGDEEHPRVTIANSDGMTFIEQVGLLRVAERIASEPTAIGDEDDE